MITKKMTEAIMLTIKKYQEAIKDIKEHKYETFPAEDYIYYELNFGTPDECSLCKATLNKYQRVDCTKCIWYDPKCGEKRFSTGNFPCINNNFNKIWNCKEYDELIPLLKERIKLLKKELNK